MKTKEEIIKAINEINNLEDIRCINDAAVKAWKRFQAEAVLDFKPHDRVEYKNKRGDRVTGTVKKVNRKNIVVAIDRDGSEWRVPGTLLKKLA